MRRTVKIGLVAGVAAALCVSVVPFAAAGTKPKPGDVPAGLSQFYRQRAAWGPCPQPTVPPRDPPPSSARADTAPATVQCTTVRVPLDYRRPDGPTETLELKRRAAGDPPGRLGVLIEVPGGPGGQSFYAPDEPSWDEVSARYDIIGYRPRGVGDTQPLLCEGTSVQLVDRTRFTEEQMRAYAEEFRRHDQECERPSGARRPYFTTANNARDLDVVRAVLGERRLNLIGKSYGTLITAVYGTLFPSRLNRNVLDSAMHPRWGWRETWKQEAISQRRTVDAWMAWVGRRNQAFGLGTTRQQVYATIEQTRAKLEEHPVEFGAEPLDGDGFDSLLGAVVNPEDWEWMANVAARLRAAAGTPPTVPADLRRALVLGQQITADEPLSDPGVFETVPCEDEWPADLEVYYADMRYFSTHYPYGWGASGAAPRECTFGTVEHYEPLVEPHRSGYPAGMVVQEEFDPQTPYEGGEAMAKQLGHSLLTVPRDGEHVAQGSNACVDAAINAYLLNGTLPKPRAQCAGRPFPDVPADTSATAAPNDRPSLDQLTATVRATLDR
jgi:pimeloyl-ACP methyl ester carboxylesterase